MFFSSAKNYDDDDNDDDDGIVATSGAENDDDEDDDIVEVGSRRQARPTVNVGVQKQVMSPDAVEKGVENCIEPVV